MSPLQLICSLVLILAQVQSPSTSRPPLKLRIGDILKVVTTVHIEQAPKTASDTLDAEPDPYQGDFLVQNDGAIYGVGFGRLVVVDKTVSEAQTAVRKAMRRLIKPTEVFVTLKSQHKLAVYVVGKVGLATGSTPYTDSMTLTQSLAGLETTDFDLLEVQVFRGGKSIARANLRDLLQSKVPDVSLQPEDVIAVTPVSSLRIWVTGAVKRPGRQQLPEGTNVFEAVAAAGGVDILGPTQDPKMLAEYTVVLHRGGQDIKFAMGQTSAEYPKLEAGDSVQVVPPTRIRVTVGGEVNRPGEVLTKAGLTMLELISQAGGATRDGTLSNVLVFRGKDWFTVDARTPEQIKEDGLFRVEDGDIVLVRRNRRTFYVFGEVLRQGEIFIQDDKVIHAVDALALAGGLSPTGTLRRMYISRPARDGKAVTTEYNLDEFLKDGKASANPVIQPGDVLLFSKSRETTISVASQILSSLLLVSALKNL